MKLNGNKLSKEDSDKIIEELQESKSSYETDNEYQDFIKECLRISKNLKVKIDIE